MPILYIVATPIGNLKDISERALEVLREVDFILCEDTRVTRKLLGHYSIQTPTLSYHQHSNLSRIQYILELLKSGKNLALVSDAGTPGISDPGNMLVSEVVKQLNNVIVVPIPGPSALTVAASIAGLPMDKFLFLGYPPAKKKRKKCFEEAASSKYPVVLYESPHRIVRTLEDLRLAILRQAQDGEPSRTIGDQRLAVVARELTKKFETVYRGTVEEVAEKIAKETPRGEYTIVIEGKKK